MADDHFTRITLRIPKDLVQEINRAAFITSKSQNAEIVGRLRDSFKQPKELPAAVQEAVEHEMSERGGTQDEALARLVMVGHAIGGTVVNISIDAGTTVAQVNEMIGAAAKLLPQDASIYLERRK